MISNDDNSNDDGDNGKGENNDNNNVNDDNSEDSVDNNNILIKGVISRQKYQNISYLLSCHPFLCGISTLWPC